MRAGDHPRLLLVEGETERRLLPELLEANGVVWSKDEVPVYIEPMGGFDKFWRDGVIRTHLKAARREAVGLIFDADQLEDRRWKTAVSKCRSFAELPALPPAEGWIGASTAEGPRFGVWMMPDNQSRGYLETFLHFLVRDSDDPLYQHAKNAVQGALERNAAFDPIRGRDKAEIHTLLAWQQEPGKQLHDAIKHRVLHPESDLAAPFVTWFRTLFEL